MQKPFIYFDQGQVLLTNDWEFPCPEKDRLFYGYYRLTPESFYPARRAYIKDLQRGKLTEKDYWQKVLEKAKAANSDPDYAISLARKFQKWIPGMKKILHALHTRKFRLGVITTTHREIWEYKFRYFKLEGLFEHVVTSYETGFIKPEKEIYEIAINRTGVKAFEIIYIDDGLKNTEGAKEIGIDSILFGSTSAFQKELSLRGINIQV